MDNFSSSLLYLMICTGCAKKGGRMENMYSVSWTAQKWTRELFFSCVGFDVE
jgi:hypothetical protein